jgi:sugar/nucleoside kinase (ribokinase family)
MTHVALYGHVNLDRIYRLRETPRANATVEVSETHTHYGGTAGNIAAIAASLGAAVRLGSFVGADFPAAYRQHLEALGVDCTHLVQKDDYGTPTWWGFIEPDHSVWGILDQGPFRDLESFEPLLGPLDGAGCVHFSTGRPQYWKTLADHARRAKVPIVLDPGQELRALYTAKTLEHLI